jgi:phosphatidylglycerol:prolipoprotein diacylglycerol transferase
MIAVFPSRTIFLTIFGYSVHWYGVMYALAFWIAYALLSKLGELRGVKISRDQWTLLVVYAGLGVLLGGRLGYALFYQPGYFISHPFSIFQIWNGGMSSHGGFIGVAVATWIWSRKNKTSWLSVLDIATVPAAIGLALGRIGNFINQEIYTSYDAFFDVFAMIIIAGICYYLLRKVKRSDGFVIAIFVMLYSISRFFLEYIRVHEWSSILGLTRGQAYTIPLFLIGVVLFLYANKRRISAKV